MSSSISASARRRKALMAFVCFTDGFFNELFRPLHDNGPFFVSLPQLSLLEYAALSAFNLQPGPLEVELLKPMAVSIHKTGLTIRIEARARPPRKQHGLIVKCEVSMKVAIKGNHLVLLYGKAMCEIRPSTLWGTLLKGCARMKLEELIESKLKELITKMVIPGVVTVEATIVYHEGSLVVGGNLRLLPEVVQQILKRLQKKGHRFQKKGQINL
ncbi:uncharacterized protein LOC119126300 isoform X3 [Syngnathus acus]|uniref:uncharacterized protein LOC119126300 isoform X3 n=1 Tax=Syngnathus acus TaxID=161584 RepID=UPI0018860331|nr:uncharacterized protein LOC119126300 isoform X3 [Syngnathus acus]